MLILVAIGTEKRLYESHSKRRFGTSWTEYLNIYDDSNDNNTMIVIYLTTIVARDLIHAWKHCHLLLIHDLLEVQTISSNLKTILYFVAKRFIPCCFSNLGWNGLRNFPCTHTGGRSSQTSTFTSRGRQSYVKASQTTRKSIVCSTAKMLKNIWNQIILHFDVAL